MRQLIVFAVALAWTQMVAVCESGAAQAVSDQAGEPLRSRIEAAGEPPKLTVGAERLSAVRMLSLFYEQRAYQLAWSYGEDLLPQVDALVTAIYEADREGLRPGDYHLAPIEALLTGIRRDQEKKTPPKLESLIDLDLLLTDAFLLYGSHLLAGRIDPQTLKAVGGTDHKEVDLARVLQDALEANQLAAALQGLLPPHPAYARLRQALARYRDLAARGGWPQVPDGAKLQKGDRGDRVLTLRARLLATGDLEQAPHRNGDLFDEVLLRATRRFQRRHGLNADGVVGPDTLAALNVPVDVRVRQIALNLERWRWLPHDLGQRYILVNIADFALEVVENGQPELTMRIVVGNPFSGTPVFNATLTSLVLNPFWHIPPSIAVKEMLPQIRKDPGYLATHHIKVVEGRGGQARKIDPSTINWSKLSAKDFPYRLYQEPGPLNALGRVKFVFPNQFNVYLHDTPSRELFSKTVRAFSHGCIRIEKPIELAEYVLREDPRWTRDTLLAAITQGVERTVWLPQPLPIHLLYWTAEVDQDGTLQFRPDIYSYDKLLDEALHTRSGERRKGEKAKR